MLILRRREGESILIGDDVEIEIVQIGANKVRVGVRAPDHVRVVRKEIHVIGLENAVASAISPELRKAIVDQICGKTFLNIHAELPISSLTDTSGIP
jgi:carbon storage regulator